MEYHDEDFNYKEHLASKADLLSAVAVVDSGEERDQVGEEAWDAFYAKHNQGLFFKPRNYLPLEFPDIRRAHRILELGCGYGCSMGPLLRANHDLIYYGCDMSAKAIAMLQESPTFTGNRHRCRAFVCDLARDEVSVKHLEGDLVDMVLMVFCLSAIQPSNHSTALAKARSVLKPRGLLLFRDYAIGDVTQCRAITRLDECLYRRPDGTLAFYFSVESFRELLDTAGFDVLECKPACVRQVNRRDDTTIDRCFVHAVAVNRANTVHEKDGGRCDSLL